MTDCTEHVRLAKYRRPAQGQEGMHKEALT